MGRNLVLWVDPHLLVEKRKRDGRVIPVVLFQARKVYGAFDQARWSA